LQGDTNKMTKLNSTAVIGALVIMSASMAVAGNVKQSRLNLNPGAVLTIVNGGGSVSLHAGTEQQVVINATTYSDKVEVDTRVTADRTRGEVITHALSQQRPSAEDAKVDYDIAVPSGISVIVNTSTAPITVEGVSGDITVSSDTGQIVARRASKSHLHVRSINASVEIADVNGTHVEVTTAGGPVRLTRVSGPSVEVSTTTGKITYIGDCAGGGKYKLSTHNAPIDVFLPETASVDMEARSSEGSVDSDFPFTKKDHESYPPTGANQGRAFSGTSNSGLSSVDLRSYSGRIRVKKQ